MCELQESRFCGEVLVKVLWEGAIDDLFLGENARLEAQAHAAALKSRGYPSFYDDEEEEA